jgi:predicted MFS family arabinose efflux permease
MRLRERLSSSRPLRFVFIIGIANLFADFTYEAARSINGQFLGRLGAAAWVVGFTAGFGELIGYGLRSVAGVIADRTGRYWLVTILGYAINMMAVPALALAGNWPLAAGLVIAERTGRAIRKPSTEAMLAHAGSQLGQGWVFGLNEALDQIGAMLGPLLIALVLLLRGSYRTGYALLSISALFAIATVLVARHSFPKPQDLEAGHQLETRGLPRSFWGYMLAGGCIAAGFADFALIGYHLQHAAVVSPAIIPVFYAIAMGVGALGAIVLGRLLDRYRIKLVIGVFFVSAFFAPMVFLGSAWLVLGGMVLWGISMSAQESVLKSLVAGIIASARRATAFGVFDTGYGVAWFAGSWLMGYLYGRSIHAVVIFSLAAQLVALLIFALTARRKVT